VLEAVVRAADRIAWCGSFDDLGEYPALPAMKPRVTPYSPAVGHGRRLPHKTSRWSHVLPGVAILAAAALILMPAGTVLAQKAGAGGHGPAVVAPDWTSMLFVFLLATFIGLGVITRVSRLLHTPLMSLTNAISAIAVVGAITVAGADHPLPIRILGAVALFASMTNIVSGFLITDRMLKMFKKQA
jgi:NAD(P) transhydrogenase subunit alpha